MQMGLSGLLRKTLRSRTQGKTHTSSDRHSQGLPGRSSTRRVTGMKTEAEFEGSSIDGQ